MYICPLYISYIHCLAFRLYFSYGCLYMVTGCNYSTLMCTFALKESRITTLTAVYNLNSACCHCTVGANIVHNYMHVHDESRMRTLNAVLN